MGRERTFTDSRCTGRGCRKMVRVRMAPDIEFCMEIDLPGIDEQSRDHDVQLQKAVVHAAFVEKLKKACPECDLKIDTFTFGLDKEKAAQEAS
jgi:hypothetical protein